eukprot:173804_1
MRTTAKNLHQNDNIQCQFLIHYIHSYLMAKELILMENLPSVGKDDALLERIAKLFLIAHRNRSPLIAKEIRKYIVSSVVDRYLYDEQHQEEYDDDLNDKLTNLFKEIRDKSAKVTIDLTNDK